MVCSVPALPRTSPWRSREKQVSRVNTTSWVHKHAYPRSLNLRAVLPQSQNASDRARGRRGGCLCRSLRKAHPAHPRARAVGLDVEITSSLRRSGRGLRGRPCSHP